MLAECTPTGETPLRGRATTCRTLLPYTPFWRQYNLSASCESGQSVRKESPCAQTDLPLPRKACSRRGRLTSIAHTVHTMHANRRNALAQSDYDAPNALALYAFWRQYNLSVSCESSQSAREESPCAQTSPPLPRKACSRRSRLTPIAHAVHRTRTNRGNALA